MLSLKTTIFGGLYNTVPPILTPFRDASDQRQFSTALFISLFNQLQTTEGFLLANVKLALSNRNLPNLKR